MRSLVLHYRPGLIFGAQFFPSSWLLGSLGGLRSGFLRRDRSHCALLLRDDAAWLEERKKEDRREDRDVTAR